MASYTLGSSDPSITPDPGAGVWNSTPVTVEIVLEKEAILMVLPQIYLIVDDAASHMAHYLGNKGTNYTIDLSDMLDDVPSAKANYNREIEEAKRFVETLPEGMHNITSTTINRPLYNTKSESLNWFLAIGGYSAWGKGRANVMRVGEARSYQLTFEYKFFDRYNWDTGKSVTLYGVTITDNTMGEFHRQGLAQEFNCYGSVINTYSWGAPITPAPAPPVFPPTPPPPPVIPLPTPILPPPPQPSPTPVGSKSYVVKPGDILSKIAQNFYGNAKSWPRIYEANKKIIGSNPNLIRPGQALIIP